MERILKCTTEKIRETRAFDKKGGEEITEQRSGLDRKKPGLI
jgi:hypothetical protein